MRTILALWSVTLLVTASAHAAPARHPAMPTSNPDMTRIFEADQAVRQSVNVDWSTVIPTDAKRREETRGLMATGRLHTGEDYEHAAFVFQHGDQPADYLLAHTLAMIAVAKGRAESTWIAAATLDRYLQKIGQQQIYGTQYLMIYDQPGKATSQGAYDRDLVSDALRVELKVKTLAEQERKRQEFETERLKMPKAAPSNP